MVDLARLDISEFEDISAPVQPFDQRKLSIGTRGVLTLNRPFLRELGESRAFRMKLSRDGRYLLLQADAKGDIHFSRKGVMTHHTLRDKIEGYGFALPARYVFEWWEKEQLWIGCTEELPAPPALEGLIPAKRRRKRSAA